MLVIAGGFGGSSGAIQSYVKCGELSRSFFRVLLGGIGNERRFGRRDGAAADEFRFLR
ncbi:hypothetical protein [Paraburkholderia sp. RL17-373-BIF-A]|uniref:hypothetical protein n=1 Tax=Paraburkholderia sp. RL17-373-BIF-A TaxID=3031629 RepID=UPI0038BB841D